MKNESGIHPVEYKCLILLPEKKEKDESEFRKSKSGILYKSADEDRKEYAEDVGTFIVAGGLAFTDPDWPGKDIPAPGNKVKFDKYQGSVHKGIDGKDYRLLNDKELGAILEVDYE